MSEDLKLPDINNKQQSNQPPNEQQQNKNTSTVDDDQQQNAKENLNDSDQSKNQQEGTKSRRSNYTNHSHQRSITNDNINQDQQSLGKILGHTKKSRKQAEIESQILANRIALLKQEELKSWKKIQETKKKTDEVYKLKKRNEQKTQIKEDRQKEHHEVLGSTQKQRVDERHQKEEYLEDVRNRIRLRNHQDYVSIKKQSQENDQRIQGHQQKQIQSNKLRSDHVRHSLLLGGMRVKEYKNSQYERLMKQYRYEIDIEEKQKSQKEEEIYEMEKLELELIKKLHNTQLMQKNAFEELEQALNLKASEFEENYKKKGSKKKQKNYQSQPNITDQQSQSYQKNDTQEDKMNSENENQPDDKQDDIKAEEEQKNEEQKEEGQQQSQNSGRPPIRGIKITKRKKKKRKSQHSYPDFIF